MVKEAQTFFQNFLQAQLMAASSVSADMGQSPLADLGPESTALSSESMLESDLSALWSASYLLTSDLL